MKKIIECVPNFCVGQDSIIIEKIGKTISAVSGVELKCIDTGYYANRSVYTFIGEVEPMLEAAYCAIKIALENIDMRFHKGTHPRFGAVDVFPFIGIKNITNKELVSIVNAFAERVAIDFQVPIYLYEKSQPLSYRKNLAIIRKGEYEGLREKIANPNWFPDYHPIFNEKSGAIVLGVRDVLVAFNVNLNTKDVHIAKKIAADIRFSGKISTDEHGNKIQINGLCDGVKAIGWYIRDFDKVQVSMNIVDVNKTPVHIAYNTCVQLARKYGVEVTGSELIGCIPRKCLIEAGKFYAEDKDITEEKAIKLAIIALHLEEVKPFDMDKNIIDIDY